MALVNTGGGSMKILNKKIWNKAATFLLTAVLLCCNAVQVEAYTAIDSYPILFDNIEIRMDSSNSVLGRYKYAGLNDNTYTFNLEGDYSAVHTLYFGNVYYEFMFPYSPDLYDYYIVGTVVGSSELMKDFTFYPDRVRLISCDSGSNYHYFECTDLSVYDFVVADSNGFSFSTKMYLGDNISTFGYLSFIDSDDDNVISGDVKFSASIVPVAKGTEAEQLNQSILNELIKINQNLVTSNSLQQSTIDAINQHDAHEQSWFQQLIQSMGIGFTALYKQMTEEQDEQLTQSSEQHDELINGFDASGGNNASGNLGNSLDSMEEVESGITDKAFEGMSEYTIPEEGVTGYAQQFLTTFPLVAAMMQSIYDSSGPFNILLSVTFTFVLVSMLIGLYRFYKD